MSIENLKNFYESIVNDDKIKTKLRELAQQYLDKEINEENRTLFVNKEILPMAAQMGFPFSVDDLRQYELELRQAHMNCELSDAEMEAVTGGVTWNGFCISWGIFEGEQGRV